MEMAMTCDEITWSQAMAITPFKSWTILQQTISGNNVVSKQWPKSAYKPGAEGWWWESPHTPYTVSSMLLSFAYYNLKAMGPSWDCLVCQEAKRSLCLPPPSPLRATSTSISSLSATQEACPLLLKQTNECTLLMETTQVHQKQGAF